MPILPESNNGTFLAGIEEVKYPTTSWYFNPMTGHLEYSNNNLELMGQTIDTIMQVERFQYVIYSINVGLETKDLIGIDLGLIISLLETRIKNALSIDDRIIAVNNFNYELLNNDSLLYKFNVVTIYGTVEKTLEIQL